MAAGLDGRRLRAAAVASSSTPTSTSSRRSPSTAPPGASGRAGCATATAPASERSLQLRFHTQTAGVSLTAQQPEVNIVRTAIEALAGVLGGTQSLHTNSMDEALALPTEKAARIALRTQQVIAHETGVANVADPLGGSWFVEALTDELERQAEEIFAHLDELGDGSMLEGVLRGHRERLVPGRDRRRRLRARAQAQRRARRGRRRQRVTEGNDEAPPEILRIGPEVEESQLKRLATVKADRDDAAVAPPARAPCAPTAAEPDANLMPALIDAVRVYATEGEIVDALGRRVRPLHRDPGHLGAPTAGVDRMDEQALAVARPRRASCPTTRGSRCTRPGSTRAAVGPLLEVGTLLREVGRLPRRRGAGRRHGAVHASTTTAARRRTRRGGSTTTPRSSTRRPVAWTRCRSSGARSRTAGLEDVVIAVVGRLADRRRATGATPLGLLFIDGGHAEDVAHGRLRGVGAPRRAGRRCSRSTTCSRTRPTAARRRSSVLAAAPSTPTAFAAGVDRPAVAPRARCAGR